MLCSSVSTCLAFACADESEDGERRWMNEQKKRDEGIRKNVRSSPSLVKCLLITSSRRAFSALR
jgi:hypothetical protein